MKMTANDSTTTTDQPSDDLPTPYKDALDGETEIEWQCGVAVDDQFDDDACCHEAEIIELDEPASVDYRGEIHLPGRPRQCPECGNPVTFLANGVTVMFP